MSFLTRPGQKLTEQGVETLKTIGDQVGAALANAFKYQNARYLAAVEERDRLAWEMHDSLAQALAYLKLKASLTDELLAGGEIDKAKANLREVREIAGETYTDVREAIFSLRESALSTGFLPALERYLTEYRTTYGVEVFLNVEEGLNPTFAAETGVQLYRIIQEALTNVRKHADACRAWVRVSRENGFWRITVEDDGRGFAPSAMHRNGEQPYGIQIMRERAESVGAALELTSEPGRGTRVTIQAPVTG